MQSTSAGSSKKRGHYATRACNGCRRRRCKCDGVHPTCGACTFYGHQCSWSSEGDARRPATKQLVETLRTKIQVLEAEVARLHSQGVVGETTQSGPSHNVPAYAADPGMLGDLSPTQFLGGTADPVPSVPSQRMTTASSIKTKTQAPSWTNTRGELPYTAGPPTTVLSHAMSRVLYQYIFHIDQSLPTRELSEGARLSMACAWDRHLPDLGSVQLSRWEHDTLLHRCFKYQTIWLLPLIPELFLHQMLCFSNADQSVTIPQGQTLYYTPLLHCSLLAFAAALSEDPNINSRTCRDVFATQAKRLLDTEFANPTPSLIQALALLAEHHCGVGEREAGYMYLGIGMRAARALGLFAERIPRTAVEVESSPESVIHGWNTWSIFAQDKLMALEYGRIYDIGIPSVGVSLPDTDVEFDKGPWKNESQVGPTDVQPNRTTAVFRECCKLMVIAARITDAIYYDIGLNEMPEDSTAINLHLQLDTWFNNLPAEMLISVRASLAPLPHVILTNICYWRLLLYLYQPFYQRSPPNPESRLFTDLSIKMCDRAAAKILQLINIFNQSHGLRYFPRNMIQTIYTCGTAFLLQSAIASESANKKRAAARGGVTNCIRALRTIAPTWPVAEQMAEQLEKQLSEQVSQSPIITYGQPNTSENILEQELDDREVSKMFYHFVHEWNRDEPESPYSSGVYSHESSPALHSSYAQLGDISEEAYGQNSWENAPYSNNSLTHDSTLAAYLVEDPFHEEQRG